MDGDDATYVGASALLVDRAELVREAREHPIHARLFATRRALLTSARLTAAALGRQVEILIVLIGAPEAAALEAWCAALHPVQIHVVAGNHDRGAAMRWETVLHWREAAWQEGPFTFTHEAGPVTCDDGQWMMSGHIHPVVRLGGLRKQGARVPVFWQRAGGLVLPAFGIFTGGFVINPKPGERVFAVGPDRVVPF